MHAWKTPHAFALLAVDSTAPVLPPLDVATFGPLAADLTVLAEPTIETVTRLGRTLGFEWLLSLVLGPDRLEALPEPRLAQHMREHHGLEPNLAYYLRERYALKPGLSANPFIVERSKLRRPQPETVPGELIADFVRSERGRLIAIGQAVAALCRPLLHVAAGGHWDVNGEDERAATLFNAHNPSLTLTRVTSTSGAKHHLLAANDLYGRALLEIVEIYDTRPKLTICRDCDRLFIPKHPEQQRCRRYLYLADNGKLLATCTQTHTIQTEARAKLEAAARRRDYKKHQMRIIRLRNRLGPDHPNTCQAQREFLEWQKQHPAAVGRPITPIPLDTAHGILPTC